MEVHSQLNTLPDGLPVPVDDGMASHLEGMLLPQVLLQSTDGKYVNFSEIKDRLVVYIYPLTGRPDTVLPVGWDEIPGARGCTPQACDFSHHYLEMQALNAKVFGLSSQDTKYQLELKHRLHLPFDLLSDTNLTLECSLKLPTFKIEALTLYKRLTLIAEQGIIQKVFYPVFPPHQNAVQVIDWLKSS